MKTPATFGPYRVIDALTSNPEAISLLATPDGSEGDVLCLRFLNPEFAQGGAKAFAEPMKLAARLNHVNLLQTLDAGIWEEIPYVAMELLAGVSLAQVLEVAVRQRPTLPHDVAVFIASELSAGLAYAHSRRDLRGGALEIVHGDLRPREVLLSEKGDIKVANFGSARVLLPALQASAKAIPERFDYLAPEVARGDAPTAASDIFSVCAIAYHMLCGVPVTGASRALNARKRTAPVQPIRELDASVPEELAEIVMKGLALDPEARVQEAREVRTALSGWLRRNSPGFGRHRLKAWLGELDGLRFPDLKEGQKPLQRREFKVKDGLSVIQPDARGEAGARGGIRPWLSFPGSGASAAGAATARPPALPAGSGEATEGRSQAQRSEREATEEKAEVYAARRDFAADDTDTSIPELPERPAAARTSAALHEETAAPELGAEGVLDGEPSDPALQVPASLEDTPDAPPEGVKIDRAALGVSAERGGASGATPASGAVQDPPAERERPGAGVAAAADGFGGEDEGGATAEEDYANLVHDDRPVERIESEVVAFDLTPDPSIRAPARFSLGRAFLFMVLLGIAGAGAWYVLDVPPPQWALKAAPPIERGSVWVSSDPPNAEVFVNGVATGIRTPDVVPDLPAHQPLRIGLRLEGWEPPAEEEVRIVDARRPSLDFRMEPRPHRIRVESDPPGATVLVHGSTEGVTPMTLGPLHVPPGRTLLVTLRLEGYLDELVEARWEAGQEQSGIRAALRPDPTWEPGN